MEDITHYDILWVDDFDKGEKVDDPRKYLRDYFPDKFSFRVKIEQSFFNALVHLENNFTNYSCVVLDVNFIKGFNFDELNEDDFSYEISDGLKNKKIRFEDGEIEEFESLEDDEKDDIKEAIKKAAAIQRLYGILKKNNIIIDGALDAENIFDNEVIDYEKISAIITDFEKSKNNDDFKKNAGYYLFLYLLQRGMPQRNIAMLTGNKGETSAKWEEKFKAASLQSPKAFDRKQCELTKKDAGAALDGEITDKIASMREVLTRRFSHGLKEREEREKDGQRGLPDFSRFPDLILMDGGRGQVNIALSVLEELGIQIPVCGMVKDDRHRTRGLYFQNVELPIDTHGEGFHLVTRIQDEAHRFAIEYHRSLRTQAQVRSVLDDIPGIGPARRKALMRRFRSIEAIREADVETLRTAERMSEKAAQAVYDHFHKDKEGTG